MRKTSKIIAVASIALLPAPLMAGAYGSSAVKDERVGQYATAASTIYCARLDQRVPESLAAQMDCGSATHVVKGPRRLKDIFGPRRSPRPNDVEEDGPTLTSVNPKPPGGGNKPPSNKPPAGNPPTDNPPTENPPTASSTPKWDRLGQLGVNQGNFAQQSPAWRDQFNSYMNQNGANGDWTNFNPTAPAGGGSGG